MTERGRHTHHRSEPSLGAFAFAARSGTAQPGVDGGGAGLRVQASDSDLQVRPLIGPLEIGAVRLDFLQVEDPLLLGEVLLDASRVDVVEGDPLQDVLRRVADGHGHAGHAPDDPEEGVSQAARRQRDHAVWVGGRNTLQHHRAFLPVVITGEEPGLKPLDGYPEVSFDLIIEVEEGPAPPLSEDPADRRGAHAAHTDQADPQLRLLTATPAIRGVGVRRRRYRGIGETADGQDSGWRRPELARTLPKPGPSRAPPPTKRECG